MITNVGRAIAIVFVSLAAGDVHATRIRSLSLRESPDRVRANGSIDDRARPLAAYEPRRIQGVVARFVVRAARGFVGAAMSSRQSVLSKTEATPYQRERMAPTTLVSLPPDVAPITHVRSSSICAVIGWLRAQRHFDAYASHLPADELDMFVGLTAHEWVPIDHGLAHYRALDRMPLSDAERKEIGSVYALKIHRNVLDLAARLAQGVGLTPWAIVPYIPRMNQTLWRGGAMSVHRHSPTAMRVLWLGQPASTIAHFRVGYCGFCETTLGLFARTVRAKDVRFADGQLEIEITWT